MGGVGLHSSGARIGQCSACETALPLCEAAEPEDIRTWFCGGCGAEFRAALAQNYSLEELRGLRLEGVTFDVGAIQPVPPEMQQFVQELVARNDAGVEKRRSRRHNVVATLKAMQLDRQLQPLGLPFQAVCRNLSAGGICLLNNRAIRTDLLVLELSNAGGVPVQILAHVLRRRPLGPYHDIGCEFVTKLSIPSPPTSAE